MRAMDNETLRLIARLKINAARAGMPVDVVRFVSDRLYAKGVLQRFSDAAAEEGVLLVLQLMDKLGMTASIKHETNVVPLPVLRPERPVAESRYVGRLR
jgi:hypothetical protein